MDQKFRDDLLIDLNKQAGIMSSQIEDIKEDLKTHIKRSTQNELMIQNLEKRQLLDMGVVKKHIFAVQFLVGVIGVIASLLAIAVKLGIFVK